MTIGRIDILDVELPDNLFADLLAYQQTEEFQQAASEQHETERSRARAYNNAYLHDHPNKKRDYARRASHTPNGIIRNRLNRHRRRARLYKLNRSTLRAADVRKQYLAQKGLCYYCRRLLHSNYEIDHVIPLSRGGADSADNVVIACPTCNNRKRDKLPHEWLEGGRLL